MIVKIKPYRYYDGLSEAIAKQVKDDMVALAHEHLKRNIPSIKIEDDGVMYLAYEYIYNSIFDKYSKPIKPIKS